MPSRNSYCLLLGFLLHWMWGISSQLLQQRAASAPYLGQGYFLTAAPPDLECGVAPLGPPAPMQPLLLGRGVVPLGRRPALKPGKRGGCGLAGLSAINPSSLCLEDLDSLEWIKFDEE